MFYERHSGVPLPGVQSTPEQIGKTLAVVAGVGAAAHAGLVALKHGRMPRDAAKEEDDSTTGGR